jgi:hypothetical protein
MFGVRLGAQQAGHLKDFSAKPGQKSIWYVVIPILLLALVIGTTIGPASHRHDNCSPVNCPICHLSHQVIEPPQAGAPAYILIPTGPGPEPQQAANILSPVTQHLPARAPPA